jgi:hypothetical protein
MFALLKLREQRLLKGEMTMPLPTDERLIALSQELLQQLMQSLG